MPSPFSKPKKTVSSRRPVLKKKSKLSFKLIAPALAMVITLAGAGIATMLAQKSQENRGQAAGCNPNVDQPRCSDNDGHWWTCQDPGGKGDWSYQKGGVCNDSIVNPPDTALYNPDGTCISPQMRCEGGFNQRCVDGKWAYDVFDNGNRVNCNPSSQPRPGESCAQNVQFCNENNIYMWCQCLADGTNCSWQEYSSLNKYCKGGSGSTQTGSSQSSNQTPIGWMDSANGGTIIGWAADPDAKTASIKVHFYMDAPAGSPKAKFLGEATPSITRPDILTGLGLSDSSAKHGYAFAIPGSFLDGAKHLVFAHGIDTSGVPTANALLEPVAGKEIIFNRQPVGHIDSINGRTITGWAADPDALFESIDVHFYKDGPAGQGGTFIGGVTTTIQRDDVNIFLGADSTGRKHGYEFTIPVEWMDGKEHTIYAHGIDLGGDPMANALLWPTTGMKATLRNIQPRAKILGIF